MPRVNINRPDVYNDQNKKFIKAISEQRTVIANAEEAISVMQRLIEIAFAGGFAGGGAYFEWECGSWLHEEIQRVVIQCEEISSESFHTLIATRGQEKTDKEWSSLVDSYLLLPIPSYKKATLDDLPKPLGERFAEAMRLKHAEWHRRAFPPSPRKKK